jgi:hypothetical protein
MAKSVILSVTLDFLIDADADEAVATKRRAEVGFPPIPDFRRRRIEEATRIARWAVDNIRSRLGPGGPRIDVVERGEKAGT